MVNSLRPFFTFYGGKWRAAPHYPEPRYSTIVEPFAGSAGYSLRYPESNVVLVEKDPLIAATWRYLLRVSPAEILALPDIDMNQTVDDLDLCSEARLLIGWWLNGGSAQPKKRPGAWMRRQAENGGEGWTTGGGKLSWGARVRERIASQVETIRHWTLIEGDYEQAPAVEATWFVDPPYQRAGRHYRYSEIDYGRLAQWCSAFWRGQVIVCENVGASWLPFRPWRDIKASEAKHGGKVSHEAIWTRGCGLRGGAPKDDAMPPPNYERRLTYRFLTLPFRHQIAVAKNLDVLTDADRALSDEALFRVLFKRAAEKGLLGKLWAATEKLHGRPQPF